MSLIVDTIDLSSYLQLNVIYTGTLPRDKNNSLVKINIHYSVNIREVLHCKFLNRNQNVYQSKRLSFNEKYTKIFVIREW